MKHLLLFVSGGLTLSLALLACVPATQLPTVTVNYTPPPPDATLVPVTGVSATPIIIQHKVVPRELPATRLNHSGDYDSSVTEHERRAPGGDRFTFGQFERPFNAETMDIYYPDLDIQDINVYKDEIWFYSSITVKGRDAQDTLPGNFALELDTDVDGAGDLFIVAHRPSLPEWTSLGVQIWADENHDVGGKLVVNSDLNKGDGYESLIFDQGRGNNPDLAWVRVPPDESSTVELAFMHLLLLGDRTYMLSAWSGYDDLQPGLFDLNDHFTHEEAGEAMSQLGKFYPIKELSGVDNTCRIAVGFQPTGGEPGLCNDLTPAP